MSIYSRFVLGRLSAALEVADEGIALGDENPTLGSGIVLACPYAFCLYWRGVIHGLMGHLEDSALELARAIEVAERQGDLETAGWAHGWIGWLARYDGHSESALAHATQGREIAESIGSAYSQVWSLYFLGEAHLVLGDDGEAIAALERSVELGRDARTALELEAWRVAALADALLSAGETRRALEAAEESVALALQRGNQAILPMSYRVLAEALLASEGKAKITAARQALDKAMAAAVVTGARAEMPLIEQLQTRLMSVG
jgi:tetratricopeptide (TPR) repeat protein